MKIEEVYLYIKSARTEKEMTQRELGKRIGVTPQSIGQWEKSVEDGGILPPLRRIKQIQDVLEVDFGEIEVGDGRGTMSLDTSFIKPKINNNIIERRFKVIEKIIHSDEKTIELIERVLGL